MHCVSLFLLSFYFFNFARVQTFDKRPRACTNSDKLVSRLSFECAKILFVLLNHMISYLNKDHSCTSYQNVFPLYDPCEMTLVNTAPNILPEEILSWNMYQFRDLLGVIFKRWSFIGQYKNVLDGILWGEIEMFPVSEAIVDWI